MIILIPKNPLTAIHQHVIDVWMAQTEPSKIIACGVSVNININRQAEIESRQACTDLAMSINDKYICMTDPDCWPSVRTNLQDARLAMNANDKLGAVAFAQAPLHIKNLEHIDIKMFVIKTNLLQMVEWKYHKDKPCLCHNVMNVVKNNGYVFEYIDTRKRIDCF